MMQKRFLRVMAAVVMCALVAGGPAVHPAAAAGVMPDRLVNGNFDYPAVNLSWWIPYSNSKKFVTITTDGYALQGCTNLHKHQITGWSATSFAWKSTQDKSCQTGNVELNYAPDDKNQFAELVADQAGTAIYQDVSTTPGAVYAWSIRHASYTAKHVDSMQVMIGNTKQQSAQEATRTTVNGHGDALGRVGTTIATKSTATAADHPQWETYTGSYLIPGGQTVTRFTFKSVSSPTSSDGNFLDDVSFQISYPLRYDLNGGEGSGPSTGYDAATGLYDNYFQEGTATLASGWDSKSVSRPGMTFLGWSASRCDPVTSQEEADRANIITSYTVQPTLMNTVYAVWGVDPVISYYVNVPEGVMPPDTPQASKVAFGSQAADTSGWTVDSQRLAVGYRFKGWYTAPEGGMLHDFSAPVTSSLRLYAHWEPIHYSIRLDANADNGPGVVSGTTPDIMAAYGTSYQLPGDAYSKTTLTNAVERGGTTPRTASKFLGWSLDAQAASPDYAPAATVLDLSAEDGAQVTLYAVWDDAPTFVFTDFPDRVFTLSESRAHAISEEELLSSVMATDRETRPLPALTTKQTAEGDDVGVSIVDYREDDFNGLDEPRVVSVTYMAKDSAGNMSFLRVDVSIATTQASPDPTISNIRSIDSEHRSTLHAGSVWLTDPERIQALDSALSDTPIDTLSLSADQVRTAREWALSHGPGTSLEDGALDELRLKLFPQGGS
ncbi:InlB B-repeat-containing protein [Bifidobacterium fermentum]|uniref:InlB B-repeat-containing protein n=1 Tax=Bifidobacterium fermentum TaxID=3059035 RepID=A0AB39UFZ9_9BIFI